MRKTAIFFPVILGIFLGGCASGPKISRIDAGTQTDISGRWNDTDARIVCNTLIESCLNSGSVRNYIQDFQRRNGGRRPAVVVGAFTNASSEPIDTAIIAQQMEIAIVNSGMLEFVAGGDDRDALRTERMDQQGWASDETASSLGNETGASLKLTGTIRSVVDRAGGRQTRAYFVSAKLTNVETGSEIWMDSDNSIKKDISRSAYRP